MAKPKIRFNGYTEDWEQRKLGDIADVTKLAGFEFTEHVVYSDEGNVIALRGLNIKNGQLILDDVKYIDGSNFSKLSRSKLFIDDIMFTYVGTVGEVAIIKENDRFYLAPNVSRIRVKSDDSPKFISHYMRTGNFKNKVIFPLIATSSQPALSMENIRKFTINIPINREEQDCLAKYFDSLDNLITLHQRKCEQTKTLKKYMLQKMFPQDGEKVPQIRFEGFTEDWEQRKVLDLLIQPITDGPHETPKLVEEGVPFISVDAIVDNKIDFNRKRGNISEEYDELCCKKYKPQFHDVYLVKSGSTVGKVAIVETTDRFNIWSPLAAMRCGEKTYPYFLYDLLQTKDLQAQVADKASNGTQPNLSMRELEKFPVSVPSNLEEQKKIGDYFRNLDHLITLHQRKCDELKEVKKFMLQNMFV